MTEAVSDRAQAMLACPFCGEPAIIDETEGSQASGSAVVYRVRCERFSCAESPWQSSTSEAVQWWNVRSPRTAIPAPSPRETIGDEDGLILMMLNELHDGMNVELFMSMSDLSDDQARRARNALRAIEAALRSQGGEDPRIAAVRRVIEDGYQRTVSEPFDKCSHGRLGVEDCIGCYDEALLAALASPVDGEGEISP